MRVDRIDVPTGCIRLPDLDERAAHGPPVAVENPTGEDDALAERLPPMLAREVRILSLDWNPPKRRAAPPMEPFLGQVHQLAPRRAQQGRAIVREEIRRLEVRLGQRP